MVGVLDSNVFSLLVCCIYQAKSTQWRIWFDLSFPYFYRFAMSKIKKWVRGCLGLKSKTTERQTHSRRRKRQFLWENGVLGKLHKRCFWNWLLLRFLNCLTVELKIIYRVLRLQSLSSTLICKTYKAEGGFVFFREVLGWVIFWNMLIKAACLMNQSSYKTA